MHSSSLIITFLPVMALALPQMPGCRPEMPCYTSSPAATAGTAQDGGPTAAPIGGGLGLNNAANNAAIDSSLTASSSAPPPPPPASSSAAPPANPPIATGPSIEAEDEAANNARTSCSNADDCDKTCKSQFPNVKAVGSTCVMAAPPGQPIPTSGFCACYNGQPILDMILDLGQILCTVGEAEYNFGMAALDVVAQAIPFVGEAADAATAAKDLYKIGKTVVKQGVKKDLKGGCGTNYCATSGANTTFTAVDQNDLNMINDIVSCI